MRKFLLLLSLLPLYGLAQLNGGATYPINGVSNAPISFSTIQNAATYLNTNGVTGTGNIILELQTGYNPASEPATGIVMDSIPGTAANRRVIFRPATGFSAVVSLSVAGNATLNLQRVNFVSFDGRPGGTGTTKALTFTNTSTSGTDFTGALKLINSSKFNQFLYCTFIGNAALATSSTVFGNAVVQFGGASTFAAGNNGNKLYRCDVNGNGAALQLLVSRGSTASPEVENTEDTIRACNFYDNFSNLASNIALNVFIGNTDWYIDSNNIYQTVPRSYTVQALHTGIATVLNFTGESHVIAYNNVGGNAPSATGTMTLQGAATNAVGYVAISCQHGEGSFIFGNTIRNITLSYAAAAGSFGNAAIFANMQYSSGVTNIGFNNISNLSFSNTNGFIRLRTIYLRSVVTASTGFFSTVQPVLFAYNNIITNITATGSGVTGSAEVVGITNESVSVASLTGGTSIGEFYVYDNKVTQLTATAANTNTIVRGINTLNSIGSAGTSVGNYNEIIKDTIAGLSTNSTSVSVAPGSATGIFINSGLLDTSLVQQCDISNIANTTTADISNAVCGIAVINGSWDISRNRIYDLKNGATGATLRANIFGINVRASIFATSNVHNNQLSIGSGQNNNLQVFGIVNNTSATNQLNLLYNTVLISGAPTSGAANSAAIYRGSDTTAPVVSIVTPILVQNNLCINKRSGGTGNHTAIFNQAGTGASFVTDFNTLVSANTATAGQWGAAAGNFATWKSSSAGDIYSYYAQSNASSSLSTNPAQVNLANLFFNASFEANGNLGIDSTKAECWLVAGKAKAVATISGQFNRGTNLAYPTCIGASEFKPQAPAPCSFESAAPSAGGTTTYTFAGRNIMSIAWGVGGILPSAVCVKYYSGKAATPASPANNYSASYWEVTAATGSGYTYTPTINFSASERGTVPFTNTDVKQSFFNGAGWQYLGPSATANTATNPATSTIANINNQLGSNTALILTDVSNPIPVDLLYFNATRNGAVNNLAWATAQEINSSKFVVERSSNGGAYTPIGDVAAAGNSTNTINLYRLRMLDKDNHARLSWTRQVRNEGLANVSVYPNPVLDKLTVNIQADKALAGQVIITDVNGKAVYNKAINIIQGENLIPVNAAALQAGTYFIKVLLEGDMIVRKFNKS
jgi:hypothetical protein